MLKINRGYFSIVAVPASNVDRLINVFKVHLSSLLIRDS